MNARMEALVPAGAARSDGSALAARLSQLGRHLIKLAGQVSRGGSSVADRGVGEVEANKLVLGLLAEEVYRDRRRRIRHLPERLLGEPAWDIMLDLFAAETRGMPVSVSSACLAAEAPMSTALRWLQTLEADGLVERLPDPADARRHFVRLTALGSDRMVAYFGECRRDLLNTAGLADHA